MKVYKIKDTARNLYLKTGSTWDEKGDVFRDEANMKKLLRANMWSYNQAVKDGDSENIKYEQDARKSWVIEEYECVISKTTKVFTPREDKIKNILNESL